jgi:hypothetical protein
VRLWNLGDVYCMSCLADLQVISWNQAIKLRGSRRIQAAIKSKMLAHFMLGSVDLTGISSLTLSQTDLMLVCIVYILIKQCLTSMFTVLMIKYTMFMNPWRSQNKSLRLNWRHSSWLLRHATCNPFSFSIGRRHSHAIGWSFGIRARSLAQLKRCHWSISRAVIGPLASDQYPMTAIRLNTLCVDYNCHAKPVSVSNNTYLKCCQFYTFASMARFYGPTVILLWRRSSVDNPGRYENLGRKN